MCTPRKVENEGSIRADSIWTKPNKRQASAGAAISLHGQAADAELLYFRQQVERKLIFHPIVGDNRRDFGFHELAHAFNDREFFRRQRFVEIVEVAVGAGNGFRGLAPFAVAGDAVVFVAVGAVVVVGILDLLFVRLRVEPTRLSV